MLRVELLRVHTTSAHDEFCIGDHQLLRELIRRLVFSGEKMTCVHDPVGYDKLPCELCRLANIEHGLSVNVRHNLIDVHPLDRKNPLPEIEFMGWPVSEWQTLRKQWERYYGFLKPSQVVQKTDSEGLNPSNMPKFF